LTCATAALVSLASAADDGPTLAAPRWRVEVKGGNFEPALESFDTFYGDDDADHFAVSFARGLRPWLEAGAEVGHMRETGLGVLSTEGTPGGEVTYTLVPLHLFVNLRGVRKADQLFVPYVGLGLSSAYYKQEIDLQTDRSGVSHLGSDWRLGLQLYLNRLDGDTRGNYGSAGVKQTYLFAELQRFSTQQSDKDLGGDLLTIGFRFTFGADN
jgi:hypothetical protein